MTLEERIEKLEKRRSRTDKRPLHIAYAALVIGFASGAIGVVNAVALNDLHNKLDVKPVSLQAPQVPAPKKSIASDKPRGMVCGREGARYYCR